MSLPAEILLHIITIIFMDYLENVMPDPIRLRAFTLKTPLTQGTTLEQLKNLAAEQIKGDHFPILGPYDQNYFLPLLQTSYQIREGALSVLSDVLRIPRSDSGLSVKPWTCIGRITGFNGSRVLHIYGVVAYTEWQGWLKSTYRLIQPAYEPELPDNRVLSALYGMMTSVSDVDHHLVDRAILAIALYVEDPGATSHFADRLYSIYTGLIPDPVPSRDQIRGLKPKLEAVLPPFFKDYMVSLQRKFIALLLPLNLPAEKLAKDLGDANDNDW